MIIELLLCIVFLKLVKYFVDKINFARDISYRFKKKNFFIKKVPKVEYCKKEIFNNDTQVLEFHQNLITLKHCNSNYFYNNVNTLKIEKSFKTKQEYGRYNLNENKIYLNKDSAITHELVHMATSIVDNTFYCGFSQGGFSHFGYGINEGYTEVIANRYFGAVNDVYIAEVLIVSNLEIVIGRELMEKLFFEANLYDLVEILCKYDTNDNVIKFIRDIDFILEVIDDRYLSLIFKKEIKRRLKYVNLCMLKWYMLKQVELLEKQIITNDELIVNINNYSEKLMEINNIHGDTYKVLNKKILKQNINNILNNKVNSY